MSTLLGRVVVHLSGLAAVDLSQHRFGLSQLGFGLSQHGSGDLAETGPVATKTMLRQCLRFASTGRRPHRLGWGLRSASPLGPWGVAQNRTSADPGPSPD